MLRSCCNKLRGFLVDVQVTTDFLDRLRQMKARMNGLKTQVETVRTSRTDLLSLLSCLIYSYMTQTE